MKKETRTVVYDDELRLEACRFEGISQPFPNHFHEYYVIGLVEAGERLLSCRGRQYTIRPGCIVLFNPGDNHACVQSDGGTLDYRSFHISRETMLELAGEVTGREGLPGFSRKVLYDEEAARTLRALHEMILNDTGDLGREESLLFLISMLIQSCGQPFERCIPECREEIERACAFIEHHYAERIYLDQICRHAALGKSTLLRAFTKSKGVTPYRYLENIRISEAKKLLERGVPPLDVAMRTGFSDQSHFTNYFSSFIGLAPGVYREVFSDRSREDEKHGE